MLIVRAPRALRAALAVALLLTAAPVAAQVATVKGKGKLLETTQIIRQDMPAQSDVDLFEVPAGRLLVVTDVLVSNGAVSADLFQLDVNASQLVQLTHPILVTPQSTQSFHFGTGFEFPPGSHVVAATGPAGGLSVTLSGYLRKP